MQAIKTLRALQAMPMPPARFLMTYQQQPMLHVHQPALYAPTLPKVEDCAEPFWQEEMECIQTYDRKKLKMKKHQRQKLKKLLWTKLKWSGKV